MAKRYHKVHQKVHHKVHHEITFSHFIDDPLIGSAMLVLALIALFLSLTHFDQVVLAY